MTYAAATVLAGSNGVITLYDSSMGVLYEAGNLGSGRSRDENN